MEHLIKFYPVENADCTLIKLNNGITIIVDCQLFDSLNDEDGNQIRYDVKKDLLKELGKDSNGYPYVDLFVSTHPHDDHCKGFEGNFYHGNPDDYDSKKNENEIIIGELWVTPRGIGNELADSAETIRQEAKRRRKLYDDNMKLTGDYGNHLRIIGYNKQTTFDERYGYVPGTLVTAIDGHEMAWLEMFIHAPFKEDVDKSKEDDNKNATSIVVQYSFKSKCDDGEVKTVCKLIMGGDAEHEIWQHIIDNNKDDENLTWNIFMAPHHCSWSFFNDPEKKDEVKPSAETIMQKQIGFNSCIIASSKEILDNGKNPPCYQARTEYKNRLKNKDNFFNTATDHVKGMVPQPIVFKIDKHGKTKIYQIVTVGESVVTRPAPRAGED